MNEFGNLLFGPLPKHTHACHYFLILSILAFISGIGLLLFLIYLLSNNKKPQLIPHLISLIISAFLSYYVNRVMYSMCLKTLN